MIPIVGGTDKMGASSLLGALRTYARIDGEMTYDNWQTAVRAGRTFCTCGPLMEFRVEGREPISTIAMAASGGHVDVEWDVASVIAPMTRVDLIVNGEVRERQTVKSDRDKGHWRINIDRTGWLALLIRGHHHDGKDVILAHSSPVKVQLEHSPLLAAADGVSILDQIEAVTAYVEHLGTKTDPNAYKRMMLTLTAAHRALHNRLHAQGHYHHHTTTHHHAEHGGRVI